MLRKTVGKVTIFLVRDHRAFIFAVDLRRSITRRFFTVPPRWEKNEANRIYTNVHSTFTVGEFDLTTATEFDSATSKRRVDTLSIASS